MTWRSRTAKAPVVQLLRSSKLWTEVCCDNMKACYSRAVTDSTGASPWTPGYLLQQVCHCNNALYPDYLMTRLSFRSVLWKKLYSWWNVYAETKLLTHNFDSLRWQEVSQSRALIINRIILRSPPHLAPYTTFCQLRGRMSYLWKLPLLHYLYRTLHIRYLTRRRRCESDTTV